MEHVTLGFGLIYADGYAAACDGLPRTAKPRMDDALAAAWLQGWNDWMADAEASPDRDILLRAISDT